MAKGAGFAAHCATNVTQARGAESANLLGIRSGLQDEPQELLGVSVDVPTLKDLPAKFRDTVAQEARPV